MPPPCSGWSGSTRGREDPRSRKRRRSRRPGPPRVVADMTGPVEVLPHPTLEDLAEAVAEALVAVLCALQREERVASVVLTGGSVAVKVHKAVAASPHRDDVDWGRVEF